MTYNTSVDVESLMDSDLAVVELLLITSCLPVSELADVMMALEISLVVEMGSHC